MNKDQSNENEERQELENHFVNTTKQSGIVFISKLFGYVLGFGINFILARFYGAEILGQYTLINTYLQIIIIFTIFGLDNGMIKYIAKFNSENEKVKLNYILKIAFIYSFVFSVFGSICTYFFRDHLGEVFNDNILGMSFVVGAWIIIPKTINKLFGGIYKGFKKIKFYTLGYEVYRKIVIVLLLTAFIIIERITLINSIYSLLFANVFLIIFFVYKLKNLNIAIDDILLKTFTLKKNKKTIRNELLSYSSTMILISFMSIILGRTDRIMLGLFSTTSSVGIYNIAATIGGLVIFLLVSSNMSFAPIISELYSQNKLKLLNDLYSTITRWIAMLTIPIIITIIFFAEPILNIFGQEYVIGKNVLILITLGQMVNTFVGANGYILNMSGYERLNLFNNLIMVVINILLNILLIPSFGMLGAAIATTISITFINLIKVIQVKKYLNMIPYNKKFYILFVGFASDLLIAFLFKLFFNNIYSAIIVTIINFGLSIILLYIFRDELDYYLFKKTIKKIKGIRFK